MSTLWEPWKTGDVLLCTEAFSWMIKPLLRLNFSRETRERYRMKCPICGLGIWWPWNGGMTSGLMRGSHGFQSTTYWIKSDPISRYGINTWTKCISALWNVTKSTITHILSSWKCRSQKCWMRSSITSLMLKVARYAECSMHTSMMIKCSRIASKNTWTYSNTEMLHPKICSKSWKKSLVKRLKVCSCLGSLRNASLKSLWKELIQTSTS